MGGNTGEIDMKNRELREKSPDLGQDKDRFDRDNLCCILK